ncbi:Copper resistance protein CopC (modular protein) [uncultured Microbacterium sp.]|uniref:Copper resistance protein CopC (Modular protein) n=1 Tax=uncultured Microbacterium sp. TaxID=191216 RepID=A0A1Y5P627_9MICO|nr:Copper resistance protein CopC (modular protein) [uncultured Microbacterium sp.]
MQASSIDIIEAGVIPCIRIMARIIVLHMSAQFMHAGAQSIICPSIIWTEHTTHACSQAAQASIHPCMTAMSISGMPSIDIMSFDMASLITASIPHPLSIRRGPACPPAAMVGAPPPLRKAPAGVIARLDGVTSPAPRPRRRATALAGLVLGLLLAMTASPAFAHDELIGTDPATGAAVETLPAALTLTFSGVLLTDAGATEVSVLDAACTPLTDGAPVVEGTRVTQALRGDATGTVTVLWRTVSGDSHPISGEFTFVVGDGAADPACDAATPPAGGDGGLDVAPLLVVGGVLVVAAGIVVAVLLARRRPSRED